MIRLTGLPSCPHCRHKGDFPCLLASTGTLQHSTIRFPSPNGSSLPTTGLMTHAARFQVSAFVRSGVHGKFQTPVALHACPIPAALSRSAVIGSRRQQSSKTPFTATAGTAVIP